MPMCHGSQMKLIFLLYLRIKWKISVRRFGLLILLPDVARQLLDYLFYTLTVYFQTVSQRIGHTTQQRRPR